MKIITRVKEILNQYGIAYMIGILGGLSSILTIFIQQWDYVISLKWFVFTLYASITGFVILIKLISDLQSDLRSKSKNVSSAVFRYIPDQRILLIKKNDLIGFYAMVSIVYIENGYEVEFGKGYAINIQDNYISVQIISITEDFTQNRFALLNQINHNDTTVLPNLTVKNYLTFTNN